MIKVNGLKKLTIYLLLLGLCLFACTSSYENDSAIIQVSYGTSFGMCVGYCKQDMTLKSGIATYRCASWNDSVQPITRTEVLNAAVWDSVKANLSPNIFFDLPQRIGCPDCADGGAEWVEIELANGESHKVTFEYRNEPTFLKNYLVKIREIKSKNDCN